MELSYLLAPASVILLCILELNITQGKCTLGKNGGYHSQIRIISLNDQVSPEADPLDVIEYISEPRMEMENLSNRLNYQYTYNKNN